MSFWSDDAAARTTHKNKLRAMFWLEALGVFLYAYILYLEFHLFINHGLFPRHFQEIDAILWRLSVSLHNNTMGEDNMDNFLMLLGIVVSKS